ncbi:MAG: hypothetical protein QOF72_2287 [Blastocatellia bacterium]|nr:hypothetical protein [Blastocatellia bacterium]
MRISKCEFDRVCVEGVESGSFAVPGIRSSKFKIYVATRNLHSLFVMRRGGSGTGYVLS